jgi:hypothetical protein
MKKRRASTIVFTCALAVLALAVPSPSQTLQKSASVALELTEVDLFSRAGWDSRGVSILGIRLGMTRDEARSHLQSLGYRLLDSDPSPRTTCRSERCEVCNSQDLCPGIALSFGPIDRIVSIDIERIPADAIPSVKRVAITRRFKGKTYSFFNDYSSALRRRLLGRESSIKSDPKYQEIKTYRYDRLGVIVWMNPSRFGPEKESDLVVTFTLPQTPR